MKQLIERTPSSEETLWDFADAAYFLKQSENTIRKNIGLIPHVKLGDSKNSPVRFIPLELKEWVRTRRAGQK